MELSVFVRPEEDSSGVEVELPVRWCAPHFHCDPLYFFIAMKKDKKNLISPVHSFMFFSKSCNGYHHVLEKWGNRYASHFVNFMIIHLVDASEGKRGG
jgi:hypothetical protein